MDGDRARIDGRLVAPDPGHQLIAGEDVAWMRGKEPEELEFLRGELNEGAGATDLATAAVELDLPDG